MPIQPGDIVELKSGGPEMSVVATVGDGTVVLAWFSGSLLRDATLPAVTVRKVR